MEYWKHSLVWVLLCVGVFWGEYGALQADSGGDQAMTFLDDKEAQVVRIANQSTINEESTCDLVASCATECTRGACSALRSDNLTCTTVAVNTNCFTDPASKTGVCTNIKANFDRSYLRTPPIGTSGVNGEVPFEMQNSVCSQRRLDPLFKELQMLQNSSLYYFNFYFGSVDGTFRFYPGVEVKDCYGFDPRIRPWYTGAISVQKDLVVLLDSGFTMGDSLGLATFETTRFAAAQNATGEILQTLTPNDRATVFTFNGSAQAAPLSSSYLVPDTGLNISDPSFQQLLQSVDSPTTSNSNGLSSNFTAGIIEAVSTLNQSSPSGAMKIVIIFTDGGSSPSTSELVSTIENIRNESIRLFIFDIGASTILNPALGNLAGQVGGLSEKLNNLNLIQNPLFTLNSYFSFLAQSQRNTADGKRPFWQRVYADFGNLGNVITVAYSAMSSDGTRLIGVAGIDVQTDGLGVNFRNLLDSDLVSSKRIDITTNALGATFENSSPAYNDSLGQCSNSNPQLSPFCNKDDTTSTLQDLVCCADCGISRPHSSGLSKTVVIVIVVCGVALLGLLVLSIFFWVRYCRPRTRPSGVEEFVKIPRYSYETLSVATNRFSDENKLGFGTFGVVYRGTVPDGSEVAVKMLFHQPTQGLRDFEAEIRVLAIANHTNLVALKGFCVEQHHLLVYEFVENGDLDQWLFKKPEVLPWGGRVVIALGMAKGLAYLHEDLQNHQKVFHSDIKPANILLDSNFNPKVADFGMAMLYEGGSKLIGTGGTPGYMAPEIRTGAPPTTKTDVYSYGMVVLEMVTGRKFSDPGVRNLPLWVAMNIVDTNESVRESVLDPDLLGKLEEDEDAMADRLLRIGLLCTSNDIETRPDMSAVMKMIEGSLVVPSLPVFVEENDSMQELSNTFSTDTSSLSLARSRSGPSPASDTSSQGKTWTFSETFKKLVRSGKSTPEDQSPGRSIERLPSTSSDQPGNSSNVLL